MPQGTAKLLWAPATYNRMQIAHLAFYPLGCSKLQGIFSCSTSFFGSSWGLLQTSKQGYGEAGLSNAPHKPFPVSLRLWWKVPRVCFSGFMQHFPFTQATAMSRALSKNADCFYLTDEDICCFKVSSIHFRWFTRNRFYFNTYFLAFFCNLHWLMVYFNTCNYSNFNKLQYNEEAVIHIHKASVHTLFSEFLFIYTDLLVWSTALSQQPPQNGQSKTGCTVSASHWKGQQRQPIHRSSGISICYPLKASGVDFPPLLATRNDNFAHYFVSQYTNCSRGGREGGRLTL